MDLIKFYWLEMDLNKQLLKDTFFSYRQPDEVYHHRHHHNDNWNMALSFYYFISHFIY